MHGGGVVSEMRSRTYEGIAKAMAARWAGVFK